MKTFPRGCAKLISRPWSQRREQKKLPERNRNAGLCHGSSWRRMRVIVTRRSPRSSRRGRFLHHCCRAGGLCLSAAHTHTYLLCLSGNLWVLCSYLLSICQKNGGWRLELKAASLNSHGGGVGRQPVTHAQGEGATIIGGGGFCRRQRSPLSLPQTRVVSGLQPRRKSGQLSS